MKACRGKRKHPTWEAAVAAAIRCSRANRPLRVYECPRCIRSPLTKRPAHEGRVA